jgi:pantoate--beta-alanine ligase
MVQQLNLPIEIIAAPIIREPDGLAMSSRNVRLTAADRKSALIISKALQQSNFRDAQGVGNRARI